MKIFHAWLEVNGRKELLKQWSAVYLHLTIHRLVPTEAGAAPKGAEADLLGFGDDGSHCSHINRKCKGENPAYVSWAKRNAHALRAKSETCQKEETDFHR